MLTENRAPLGQGSKRSRYLMSVVINHGSGPDASAILAKSLVIAIAVPLTVPTNGLRIFVLAKLGTRFDRSFLTGKLHHPSGIIYFLIALAAISFLIWIARYGGRNRRAMAETHH
jgi:exosortase/archaeosortase family protein